MSIPTNKICSKCNQDKLASEYTLVTDKRGKKAPYLFNMCKACKTQYQKKYQQKYNSQYAKQYRQKSSDKCKAWAQKSYQARKEKWINFMKQHKCADCGHDDYRVLQWHHIDPKTKSFTIGAYARQKPWDTLMKEVKKCKCLCAYCHIILHYEEDNK